MEEIVFSLVSGEIPPKRINLSREEIGAHGMVSLVNALKKQSAAFGLQHLNLSHNYLNDESARLLVDWLENAPPSQTLKQLTFHHNELIEDGADAFARVLSRLESLDLSSCRIPSTKHSLGRALALPVVMASLRELVLDDNSLHDEGIAEIVEAMRLNSTLQTLSLRRNNLSFVGVASLASALLTNDECSLQALLLDNNEVVTSVALLSLFVARSKTLRRLSLVACVLVDASSNETLVAALRTNRTLTELNLSHNDAINDDEVSVALVDTLETNWSLVRLELQIDSEVLMRRHLALSRRNEQLLWPQFRRTIYAAVIALAPPPFQLPPYVILFILDGLPFVEVAVSHVKKIRLIESIVNSIRRIYGFELRFYEFCFCLF